MKKSFEQYEQYKDMNIGDVFCIDRGFIQAEGIPLAHLQGGHGMHYRPDLLPKVSNLQVFRVNSRGNPVPFPHPLVIVCLLPPACSGQNYQYHAMEMVEGKPGRLLIFEKNERTIYCLQHEAITVRERLPVSISFGRHDSFRIGE